MTLLEELKEYLRIDGGVEDTSLNSFIAAAQIYLENAGVILPDDYYLTENDRDVYSLLRLAIMMMATHFYENRTVITANTARSEPVAIPYGLQSIILQLKAESLPSESDTL